MLHQSQENQQEHQQQINYLLEQYKLQNNEQKSKSNNQLNHKVVNHTFDPHSQQHHKQFKQQEIEQQFENKNYNEFSNKKFIKIANDIPQHEILTESVEFQDRPRFEQQQYTSQNVRQQLLFSPPPLPPKKTNNVERNVPIKTEAIQPQHKGMYFISNLNLKECKINFSYVNFLPKCQLLFLS